MVLERRFDKTKCHLQSYCKFTLCQYRGLNYQEDKDTSESSASGQTLQGQSGMPISTRRVYDQGALFLSRGS